jgi:hypothetical protein
MSEPDFTAIADRLFGGSNTPSTAQSVAQTPNAATSADAAQAAQLERGRQINEQTAARQADEARKASFNEHGMWKPAGEPPKVDVPDAISELRNTPERRMFSADAFNSHVDTDALISASPLNGLTPAQLDEIRPVVVSELHRMYADSGLTHEEAQLVERVIVDVRANQHKATPETDAANAQAAVQQLVERYGDDAEKALADARAFVKRDPRIGKMLDTSRAGNDPRMVLLAVEAARRARARGEKF